ncbi:hypothetical protein Tco_0386552 [Tanacetum coccineum]
MENEEDPINKQQINDARLLLRNVIWKTGQKAEEQVAPPPAVEAEPKEEAAPVRPTREAKGVRCNQVVLADDLLVSMYQEALKFNTAAIQAAEVRAMDTQYLELYNSRYAREEGIAILGRTGMLLGPERYTLDHNPIDPVATFILLILAFSWFQDGRISYEEFQTTMKAGTEWRKASLGKCLFLCSLLHLYLKHDVTPRLLWVFQLLSVVAAVTVPIYITLSSTSDIGNGVKRENMVVEHAESTIPDSFKGGFCAYNFTSGQQKVDSARIGNVNTVHIEKVDSDMRHSSKSQKVLGITLVAIIDRQLPFEYTITSRSTDVEVMTHILFPPAPAADSAANVLAEWNAIYDAYNEVACLMLGSMTPELHRQFKNYSPYEMLQELKSMFGKQAGVERFDLIQTFHACKQEEGKSVAAYVLQMKGYVDQLERLGYVLLQDLTVGLILNGLTKDFAKFLRNYNMHNMGKTIGELHAMLIKYEKGLP